MRFSLDPTIGALRCCANIGLLKAAKISVSPRQERQNHDIGIFPYDGTYLRKRAAHRENNRQQRGKKSIEKSTENDVRNHLKISEKSLEMPPKTMKKRWMQASCAEKVDPGHHKGVLRAKLDVPGTPGRHPGASREHPRPPESVPEQALSIPEPSRRRPESSKIDLKAPQIDFLMFLEQFLLD